MSSDGDQRQAVGEAGKPNMACELHMTTVHERGATCMYLGNYLRAYVLVCAYVRIHTHILHFAGAKQGTRLRVSVSCNFQCMPLA